MISLPRLLLVGGTARNLGKTTLLELVLKKFSASYNITAVKVSNFRGGDTDFHGDHGSEILDGPFSIRKEEKPGHKDSQRFLAAGARQSFFVQCLDEHLDQAWQEVLRLAGENAVLVCESNSLRRLVRPGLFIMLQNGERPKASVTGLLTSADLLLQSPSRQELQQVAGQIRLTDEGWSS